MWELAGGQDVLIHEKEFIWGKAHGPEKGENGDVWWAGVKW